MLNIDNIKLNHSRPLPFRAFYRKTNKAIKSAPSPIFLKETVFYPYDIIVHSVKTAFS